MKDNMKNIKWKNENIKYKMNIKKIWKYNKIQNEK